MKFSEKLKKLRFESGLTQKQVAKNAGMPLRTYISYENSNSRPRQKYIYVDLAKVFNCDVEYLIRDDESLFDGMKAGLGVLAAVLPLASVAGPLIAASGLAAAAGAVAASASKGKNIDEQKTTISGEDTKFLDEYKEKQERFRALATGILTSRLVQLGIFCKTGDREALEGNEKPDVVFQLIDQDIDSWWFSFWTRDKTHDQLFSIVDSVRPQATLSAFITALPDARRKISFVTDDERAFQDLCIYKDRNCFRGNLSAILVDIDKMLVKQEVFISHHNDNAQKELLKLVED